MNSTACCAAMASGSASGSILRLIALVVSFVCERRGDAGIVAYHVCAVGRIHQSGGLGTETRVVNRAVAGDDRLRMAYFDYLVIKLVADQSVAIGQPYCPRRQRRRIDARASVREVLPDVVVEAIHFNDPVVIGIGKEGIAVGEPAGEGDAAGGSVDGKRGDDVTRSGVRDLDGAVVVLVGDKNM